MFVNKLNNFLHYIDKVTQSTTPPTLNDSGKDTLIQVIKNIFSNHMRSEKSSEIENYRNVIFKYKNQIQKQQGIPFSSQQYVFEHPTKNKPCHLSYIESEKKPLELMEALKEVKNRVFSHLVTQIAFTKKKYSFYFNKESYHLPEQSQIVLIKSRYLTNSLTLCNLGNNQFLLKHADEESLEDYCTYNSHHKNSIASLQFLTDSLQSIYNDYSHSNLNQANIFYLPKFKLLPERAIEFGWENVGQIKENGKSYPLYRLQETHVEKEATIYFGAALNYQKDIASAGSNSYKKKALRD